MKQLHLISAPVILWALVMNVQLNADSLTKEFPAKTAVAVEPAVYAFSLNDVKLLDGPFKQAMDHNAAWLKSLEPDRLLARFRKEAGLEPKGEIYGGWEKGKGSGHSLGHYLSACSMQYAATGDLEIKNRVDYIIDELALCQEANKDGYLSAIPNGHSEFAAIAKGVLNAKEAGLKALWVPWYVQHKIYAGLRDAYVYAQNEKALTLLKRLSDWAIETTKLFNDEQWQQMLSIEHGGMNEVLADVYALTGDHKYLKIAEKFYHKAVLDPLSQRVDIFPMLHANTQIPKIFGAIRLYELTGNEKYHNIGKFSWDTIIDHYTYPNGGNSTVEHFGRSDELSEPLHDSTETCNTYNMLKLTRHLYALDPNRKYMDYYECAMWNHILASQNPMDGMVMYKGYLDMPTRKKFSIPYDSFWCCVGTGFENHPKYGESIWAWNKGTLYLNQFIASELIWRNEGVKATLETKFPQSDSLKLSFQGDIKTTHMLKIRKPGWVDELTCMVNGKPQKTTTDSDGYLLFSKIKDGDVIELKMPMTIHVRAMPDKPNRIAFLFGPILLAADLSGDNQLPVLEGPTPSLLLGDLEVGETLPILLGDSRELATKIKPVSANRLEFIGEDISRGLEENSPIKDVRFIPLYQITNQKYTVYMDILSEQAMKQLQQDQRNMNVEGVNMVVGQHSGHNWRQANDGGWFAFDLETVPEGPMELVLTYWCIDDIDRKSRDFDILVNGTKIAEETMKGVVYRPFTDRKYLIPKELSEGKQKVCIKLAAKPGKIAGRLYDAKIVQKTANK